MSNPIGNAQMASMNDRVQSYQNICNILTESVSKAKQRYQHLQPGASSQQRSKMGTQASPPKKTKEGVEIEGDERILKQK